MFIFILKMFIKLLSVCTLASFSRSLVFNSQEPLRCATLNNQPCHARPTFVDMNSNETFFYPFTVSVNKCGRSFRLIIHMFKCVFQI